MFTILKHKYPSNVQATVAVLLVLSFALKNSAIAQVPPNKSATMRRYLVVNANTSSSQARGR